MVRERANETIDLGRAGGITFGARCVPYLQKWIDPENNIKCPDHDHLTGSYHFPPHQACNHNYRIYPAKFKYRVFHNLKNYDAHLLISAAKPRHGKIKCIPNTAEKYISFSIGDIVFKDSLAMTQASLDSPAKNLITDQLINTRRWLKIRYRETIDHHLTPPPATI